MRKFFGVLLSLYPLVGSALDSAPWFGNVYEFALDQRMVYQRFRFIDRAIEQPAYAYNTYLTATDLSLTLAANVSIELEAELVRTPNQLYGLRSGAIACRYGLFDDIAGDCISSVVGLDLRGVTGRAVHDVCAPYASYMNYEAFVSVGKELAKQEDWKSRAYAVGFLGVAGNGSLWNRMEVSLESKIAEHHVFKGRILGYFGYGKNKDVNLARFSGWGEINHSSIDLGVDYGYLFSIWGRLDLSFAYRIWAKSYPEWVKTCELRYTLPFSLF